MSAHTPGPLTVGYYTPTDTFRGVREHVAVMKPNGELVALTGSSDNERTPSSLADAKLYAAAPALLAALVEMVESGEGCAACGDGLKGGCGCRYERARAAIAAARGGGEAEVVRVPAENLGDLTGTKFGEQLARYAAKKARGGGK